MGAKASVGAKASTEPYKPVFDLEILGRCAGERCLPGAREKEAFQRFQAHEAPTLAAEALELAVAAVEASTFAVWPAPPPGLDDFNPRRVADQMRGALFGAAVSDACGLATEFLSRDRAEEFYGQGFAFRPGCELYPDTHRAFFPTADWTDDTDQLVLVLQSLLACAGEADQHDFARRLKRWAGQGFGELGDRCGSGLGKTVGKVVSAAGFEDAPAECAERVWRMNGCNLAANGAVMRAAACGFPCFWELDHSERIAVALCQVTHFDPRCVASCVCVSVSISCLLAGRAPPQASEEGIARAMRHLTESQHLDDFNWHVSSDRTLDDLRLDEPHSIGYTFKALACGLHALRSPDSFEDIIQEVVSRGGDADTNAVVCGALLGCSRGVGAVPSSWIDAMPYRKWLEAWTVKAIQGSGFGELA